MDLHGPHIHSQQLAVSVEFRQIHECQVTAKLLVAADAFVVVEEITTTVQDQLVPVDFDTTWMMRGVSVHQIYTDLIDKRMGEVALLGRDRVTPVASPVNGGYDNVATVFGGAHLCGDGFDTRR